MVVSNEARGAVNTVLFNWLAYLGVAPFVIGIAMEVTGYSIASIDGRLWFTAYSCVILSFLCGIWWGGALNHDRHKHRVLLALLSNAIALIGWLALLFYRTPYALPVLALAFLCVERAEAFLKPNSSRLASYFKTRTRVSYLVIACHLIMFIALWR